MLVQKPYFPVLESEISKAGIRKKDIATAIGLKPKTLSNKLTGKTEFYLSEFLKISSMFPDVSPIMLFSHEITEPDNELS